MPRVPAVAEHVWGLFWKLERRGRAGNGYAAMPVSNQELQAFLVLRGERLAVWEIDLFDILEREHIAFLNRDVGRDQSEPRVVKNKKFSLAMFDAAFATRITHGNPRD